MKRPMFMPQKPKLNIKDKEKLGLLNNHVALVVQRIEIVDPR